MDDLKDFLSFMIVLFGGVLLLVSIIAVPFTYLEGSAKSDYLQETKGIDIAWYRAAFLPDSVFIDASVTMKNQGE